MIKNGQNGENDKWQTMVEMFKMWDVGKWWKCYTK